MSAILELPTEIQSFLGRPPSQTLLLRGPPGTGKTTLSLALLSNFRGGRFLISNRVSAAELQREFPWVGNGGRIELVDAAGRSEGVKEAARFVAQLGELVHAPEKEESLRGLWLPPPVQEAWGRASPTNPCMIVIDSWDALVERYLGPPAAGSGWPDRAELERLMLDQMSQGPVFLVLVVERSERSQLDYLVNAVLETSADGRSGRPERWLHLRKLRGTRIDNPIYPFTLEGARFQCFAPMARSLRERIVRPEAEPDPVPGAIWPGCSDFASAFGRLPVGRITLLERDLSVPTEAMVLLVRPAAGHVARSGGRVLHLLPPDIGPEELLRMYRELLPTEEIVQRVRIQPSAPIGGVPEELAKTIIPPPVSEERGTQPRTPEAARFLSGAGRPGSANLSIVWIPALRAFAAEGGVVYSPDTLPGQALAYLSGAPAHTIFIGPEDDPLVASLRPMAATRIRLASRAGRVLVWGERPTTPSYVLAEGDEGLQRPCRLLRVV
jgi:hypothetical protein